MPQVNIDVGIGIIFPVLCLPHIYIYIIDFFILKYNNVNKYEYILRTYNILLKIFICLFIFLIIGKWEFRPHLD